MIFVSVKIVSSPIIGDSHVNMIALAVIGHVTELTGAPVSVTNSIIMITMLIKVVLNVSDARVQAGQRSV